jgi:hypothetical protein
MIKKINWYVLNSFSLLSILFLLGLCFPLSCAHRSENIEKASEEGSVSAEYSGGLSQSSPMAAAEKGEAMPSPPQNRQGDKDNAATQLNEPRVNEPRGAFAPKIIYTARLELQVKDLSQVEKKLPLLLVQTQSYIANQRYERFSDKQSLFYTLRVPVSFFDSVLQNLAAQAIYVSHKSITGEDVSQLYYDLETRLASKKKALAQYQSILQKAQNVKEILEVEDRLRVIQEEIEALEGQARYYNNKIAFATIEVEFYRIDSSGSLPENSFIIRAGRALEQGWEGVVGAFIGLLYLWPILLLAFTVFFFIRRYKKARGARNRTIKPPSE